MVLCRPKTGPAFERLHRARLALMGLGDDGAPNHPGMFDHDVVSFAHGEGVRRPFPGAIRGAVDALRDADRAPVENYMFLRKFEDLDSEIRRSFRSIGVPEALARNVVLDAGTTRLMVAALSLMTGNGAGVVTPPGFYHPLAAWCGYQQRSLEVIETARSNAYKLTAAELEHHLACARPEVAPVLVLFNPTMTGAVYSADELEAIADVVLRHGMFAIEDALFAGSEYDRATRPARLAATRAGTRCLTVSGASKLHCLANLRIGWGCGPEWLVSALQDFITSSAASLPHVAKAAALGALRAPAAYSQRNIAECKSRINLVCSLVADLDVRARAMTGDDRPHVEIGHQVTAGHSVLIEFPCLDGRQLTDGSVLRDGADVTRFFLREARVAFAPALSHGFNGTKVRANVASIGTELTYDASRRWENSEDPAVLHHWGAAQEGSFDEGFAAARQRIADTFLQRVAPALARALGVGVPTAGEMISREVHV